MAWSHACIILDGCGINSCIYYKSHGSLLTQVPERHSEAFHGVKPDLSHLRVLGCDVYRHIPKDERDNKLSARASRGVFIGYDEYKNGYYKIYDVSEHKTYRTRDVEFMEWSFENCKQSKNRLWRNQLFQSYWEPERIIASIYDYFLETTQPTIELLDDTPQQENKQEQQPQEEKSEMEHKYDIIEQPLELPQQNVNMDMDAIEDDNEVEPESTQIMSRYPQRNRMARSFGDAMIRTDINSSQQLGFLVSSEVPSCYEYAM